MKTIIKCCIILIGLAVVSCDEDHPVYITTDSTIKFLPPPDSCRSGLYWICPEDSTHMHPSRACVSCHK
jgi:hypothetical protein